MKYGYLFVLLLLAAVLLAACGVRPASNVQTPQGALGLVEVTIDLRDEASPTASANFIPMSRVAAMGGIKSQAITGLNHDIQLKRKSVSFADFADTAPYTNPTRYVSATFEIANRSGINYNNMSFLATSFASGPFTTKNGTTLVTMQNATGATIPDNTILPSGINIYRGMVPTHAMRRGSAGNLGPMVDSLSADLQYFTQAESLKVAADLAVPFPGAQVLGYGFVARNFAGGRQIVPVANTCDVNTDLSCFKGQVTLAFKVPRISPRQNNPFVFSMVFLIADESSAYISQSPEEQSATTIAGLTAGSVGSFSQVRTLLGSSYAGANLNYLCSVRTAVPTPSFPGNLYLPTTLPSSPGSLDPCFDTDGKQTTAFGTSTDRATAMVIQSDGKIVVAGYSVVVGGYDFALARYNQNGSLDTTFGTGGKVTTNFGSALDQALALAIASDGKIVAAGYTDTGGNYDFAVARYNPDGTLDGSFDADGKLTTAMGFANDKANAVAIQSDGKIVVGGERSNGSNLDFAAVRYLSSGALDTTFGTSGKMFIGVGGADDAANSVVLQSDGKVLLGGYANTGGNYDFALVRLTTEGVPDFTFDADGIQTTGFAANFDLGFALALQSDGKIVLVGAGADNWALARYNPNGSLDTGFGTLGKVTTDFGSNTELARALLIQSDGKIVLAGRNSAASSDFGLARYNPDGTLDTGFGTSGKVIVPIGAGDEEAFGIGIQSDGKYVVAGYSDIGGSNHDFAVARFNP